MSEKSELLREKAREHDAAFSEAYEQGDTIGASFEAMDAIAADRKADELYRLEHPELERLDHLNQTLERLAGTLGLVAPCLVAIVVLLGFIAYKLW